MEISPCESIVLCMSCDAASNTQGALITNEVFCLSDSGDLTTGASFLTDFDNIPKLLFVLLGGVEVDPSESEYSRGLLKTTASFDELLAVVVSIVF